MSTKTTLKRIALVAVSAMGFGMLSIVPSNAAASTYSASAALSTTSLTVVGASSSSSAVGKFYVDVTGEGAAADDTTAATQGLWTGESISVTVVTSPSGKSTASSGEADNLDLTFQALKLSAGSGDTAGDTTGSSTFSTVGNALTGASFQIPTLGTANQSTDSYVSNNMTPTTADTTGIDNRYWIAVYGNSDVVDGGEYTIRVRLHSSGPGNPFIDNTMKVKFVSTIGNAGAKLTLARSGDIYTGAGLSYVTGRNVTATLTDANNGRVVLASSLTGGLENQIVPLTARFLDSAGDIVSASANRLYALDTGTAGEDHIASSTYAVFTANKAAANGVYGITTISSTAGYNATTPGSATTLTLDAGAEYSIKVWVDNTGVSATLASVMVRGSTTARDIYTSLTMSATGSVAHVTSAAVSTATAADVTRTNVDTSTTYLLPLTTKSGTLTVNLNSDTAGTDVAGAVVLVTPTWSAPFVSTAVTPATSTTGTSYTSDASGNIKIAFTNSEPLDGGYVTLSITGFASGAGTVGTGTRTVIIKWVKPAITTMSVLDPLSGTIVKLLATTTFTVGAYDQFGNAMAGEVIQPSIPGSTSGNYVLNKTYATITTGADGTATWSLTDAAAEADETDGVTFTSVTNTAVTASRTITYKAALPVVATLTMYADTDMGGSATALLSSSGLGAASPLLIETARNQSRSLSSFSDVAGDDMVTFRATAVTSAGVNANGAVCTVAASAGAHILSSTGLPVSSRNFVVSSGEFSWNAIATTPGTKTYTVTCGTATATAIMTVDNDQSDARFVTMTGGKTGTANGEGVPVTVTVTDRFGNGVSNVTFTLSASGVGSFSGGSTTQSFVTNASGSYTFLASSLVEAGGKGTFSVSASAGTTNQLASIAGYAGATVIDSTVAAGNSTASLDITFAAGVSKAAAAAEAASDAAAEAIDAANAATDAANLAAEAADAATVAAEEARDAADAATAAVEELATQVATLMAALKAQITTLANTVAKIAKKVKA